MTGGPVPNAGYRPHLDGIRALAVLAVIAFHLGYPAVTGGFIGVDVFFVLSGYLITGILLDEATRAGSIRLSRFYARRARRLLPASALVLIVVMLLSLRYLDLIQQQSVGQDTTFAALYSANWRFAFVGGDYFAPGDVPSPLVHYWSLAVEEQFYLVWPALFLGLWRLSTRRRGAAATGGLALGIGVLAAASATASVLLVGSPVAYYGTHTRAYQLLVGCLLAVVARRWTLRWPGPDGGRLAATAGAGAALVALGWLAHVIPDADDYPGVAALAVTAASVLLVAALDLGPATIPRRLLAHPVPAAIGRLSYSLYVWHWPVVVFAPLIAAEHGWEWAARRSTLVLAMIVLAGVSYLVVERPIRFRLLPEAPARAVIAVGLVLSVLVGVGVIPILAPKEAFASQALSAVKDLAEPGDCPYFPEQWGDPSTSEPCLYRQGAPDAPVVAIVGDSHAQQWQPAFERLAEEGDLTIVRLTRGGCPANDILAYARDETGQNVADEDCADWRARTYPRLIDRYDPDLVFVATRSHVRGIRDDGRDVLPTDPDHLGLWSAGWDETLRTLTAGSGRVVVSEIIPTLPRRIPACLLEFGEGTRRCDFPVAGDRRGVPYDEVVAGLGEGFDDVAVVDPTPIGCPDGTCPAMMDGIIVHRDDNHLSATFVRSRTEEFRALLAAAGVKL